MQKHRRDWRNQWKRDVQVSVARVFNFCRTRVLTLSCWPTSVGAGLSCSLLRATGLTESDSCSSCSGIGGTASGLWRLWEGLWERGAEEDEGTGQSTAAAVRT